MIFRVETRDPGSSRWKGCDRASVANLLFRLGLPAPESFSLDARATFWFTKAGYDLFVPPMLEFFALEVGLGRSDFAFRVVVEEDPEEGRVSYADVFQMAVVPVGMNARKARNVRLNFEVQDHHGFIDEPSPEASERERIFRRLNEERHPRAA